MKNLGLDLYRKLYLIRIAEEKIQEYYPTDEIKTPTHLAIGEEAIAVGVIAALKENSQIFGTYRNHGIYLAKTGETDKFYAELFGKKTGLSKGKAGSMHLMNLKAGFMGTSAVVGSTIPVAVGAAFTHQYSKTDTVVAVFFGDGAIDEGVFWESMNFACLKKLRILFVCEDNMFAIHSPAYERHGYSSIKNIVSQFDCYAYDSETTDVEEIYRVVQKALTIQSTKPKPIFMHCKYYRYLEHVGIGYDFKAGYRTEEEYQKWLKVDPINLQRKRLLKAGFAEKDILKIEQQITQAIDHSIAKARRDPLPEVEELLTDIYYE